MHRVNIHDHLGMDLDYSDTGVVVVLIIKYLTKVLEQFPEELRGASTTPEANHLFQVIGEDEANFLEEDQDDIFRHSVAHLLFMSSKSSRDIHKAVSLLPSRVKITYEYD